MKKDTISITYPRKGFPSKVWSCFFLGFLLTRVLLLNHMTKTEFMDQYKDPQWQRKRLEILQRDNFTCKMCDGTTRMLHVHHKKYIPDHKPWEYDNSNFLTLCEDCHSLISKYGVEDFYKILCKEDRGEFYTYLLATPFAIEIYTLNKNIEEWKCITYLEYKDLRKVIKYISEWKKDTEENNHG